MRGGIGSCGFKGPGTDGIVEIAYGIDPPFQRKGYATEAAHALVDFAFRHREVHVVRAHTFDQNGPSTRVLQRCGFQSLGTVIDVKTAWSGDGNSAARNCYEA